MYYYHLIQDDKIQTSCIICISWDQPVVKTWWTLWFFDRASYYNLCKWPTWRTTLFLNLFVPILYMFRATKCSSSGESMCQYDLWYMSLYMVPSKPAYHTVTYIQWHIPEVVLIQLTVLMFHINLHTTLSPTYSDIYQRSYWYNWLFWCSI